MTVAALLPDSSVESVKQAVRSTSTCSDATVLALETLFRSSSATSGNDTIPAKKGSRTTKSSTATSRSRTARTTKTKTSTQATTLNTLVEQDAARLSYQERLVLATEVFNTTLKTLSEAVKLQSSKRDDLRVRSSTSVSPRSTSPTKSKTTPRTLAKQDGVDEGVVSVAECARMALGSLRTLKTEQTSSDTAVPNVQLEQGACVLAGRYLSLGLNDMAYKELRGLKRRIQQYLDSRTTARKKTTKGKANPRAVEDEPAKERMSNLLSFVNVSQAGPLLALLVTFQSNALRLIAAEKKTSTIQNITPCLPFSDSSSPASVILAALEAGVLTKDKAAVQLQLLSNTILSLSGGHAPSASPTSKDRLMPITSLSLQLLALEIRCQSWKLSGHICDEVKEMWDPLARYLANFVHQSKGLEKSEFASMYTTIVRLQAAVSKLSKTTSANTKDSISVARIATILGQLAQESGCFDEALRLYTESINPLSVTQGLSLATVRCKIASLHFQATKSSGQFSGTSLLDAVSEATSALGMSLRGSSSDLDELLVESAKLKKLAMGWFGEVVGRDSKKIEVTKEAPSRIHEYLTAFLRFLRRYIGREPSKDEEPKDYESFLKRVNACKSIVLAGVDSAIAVGKLSIMSQIPAWEDILSCLSDCQRLLMTVHCSGEEVVLDSSGVEPVGLAFVKLSNLFWSRYLKEKEAGKGYRDLLPILKQSTYLLSTCSPAERSTGFSALKNERLALVCMEANMASESEKAFFRSITEHIDAGALDETLAHGSGFYPHRAIQDPKTGGFMLGRVLSSYLKLILRSKSPNIRGAFDDDSLSSLQRGHILEWQMGILADMNHYAHSDEAFRTAFSSFLTKLLDVYPFEAHPVRRLRVVLSGLRFSLERPNCLEPAMLQQLIEEGLNVINHDGTLGEDADLHNFAPHLKISIRLTLGLHQGDLQPDDLTHVITTWDAIMRKTPDSKSLAACVGDIDYCLVQLKAVVDYTEIHGLWKLQLSTLELILRVTELQGSGDFSEATIILSRLVIQYSRLGYCSRARGLLEKADQYLATNKVSCIAILSHQLAWVAYHLETGEIEKATATLSAARTLYENNQKKQDLQGCSVMTKISWERLVADAAFMSSRLSFVQGSINDALFFAKLSVRLNCRIWAKVERIAQRNRDKELPAADSSELDTVVEGMAKLDVSQTSALTTSTSYAKGAPFWPHIGSHHASLLNLASLSAHHGLFQDAIYYGEQALKINKTLNANVRLIASQVELGSHWICGGHISEGQNLLEAAEVTAKQLGNSIEMVSLQMALASLHRAQGQHSNELHALLQAEKAMSEFLRSETSTVPGIPDLEDKMENLHIRPSSRRTRHQTTASISTTTTRRTRATTTKSATKISAYSADLSPDSTSLSHLRSDILQQQAACSRALRQFDKASNLLNDARQYATSRDSKISLHIGESEHFLADAIRHFASHAVYCVLPESTISLPSLQSSSKVMDETKSSSKTSTVRKTRAPPRTARSRSQKANDDFSTMLSRAADCLGGVFSTATALGSTLDSHAASRLMSRISMLSHATAAESSISLSQSPANVNEMGRIGAFAREHIAIGIDKELADSCDPLSWPVASKSTAAFDKDLCSNFTQDYVDILPENWNVLSLSLSTDRNEFIISRLHRGRSPFLLRLPLRRGSAEDEEEDQFTFDDGRSEMQELIKLANESAHAAKAQTDRQAKKNWWKNREALDRQMENLLQNIENVWFGGFRGIFSPVPHDTVPLAKFSKVFHGILDKHLPSRQKGRKADGPKLTLHQNVLELFISVKDLDDQEDPEDTMMDLLYFVVDILQFQGERNAYDEIDFDMMVLETLDALKGYHESVQSEGSRQAPNHTVLVLDKALHLFPWESLPCLQGFPVCRVPSLECLRDRILQFQNGTADAPVSGLGIDKRKGTYVLNPTGDLQTTQGTFEKDLLPINGWNGIVNRVPTEDEFRDGLESSSLFLYFGHGSGAQYIRGRTIKRLDRCAVAFLMGCSSGTLTEAGEYEPYGTPMNYLHAGSPALVATLWDVTDKDIDRFAKSTFEKWGLIGDEVCDRRSLDASVSQSRSACVLKYLNGAAPVIYGIPAVFLE
ncbi:peptidase family C50-domain-containing protein [Aspergillus ambiguus]|uniref:C50 family peptidase n=1 Tax=Aspergillus ambiguus TaxID=176160 RepID=UPI003CCD16B4